MAALPGAAAQPTCVHHTCAGADKVGDSDYVVASPAHISSNQCSLHEILGFIDSYTTHRKNSGHALCTVISDYGKHQIEHNKGISSTHWYKYQEDPLKTVAQDLLHYVNCSLHWTQ